MFDGLASILIAPNIRPSLDDEELEGAQIQLALAYNEQQAKQGGFGPLARMSRMGVLPTAQSYNLIRHSSRREGSSRSATSVTAIRATFICVTISSRRAAGPGHALLRPVEPRRFGQRAARRGKNYDIPAEVLAKNGYGSFDEFRNWRFFSKYGAGPISDLGAHQIDMFNWMYDTTPVSVMAQGGV